MIQIRSLFHGWADATAEEALNLAKHIYRHSVAPEKDIVQYINTKRVKGIAFTADDLRDEKNGGEEHELECIYNRNTIRSDRAHNIARSKSSAATVTATPQRKP